MDTPLFLSMGQIVLLHGCLIQRYGGIDGIRDNGLLQSAIAMPLASYGGDYLHADIFEIAAAYMFHIVQNHPFLDGNKRTGAAAAIVFLAINEIEVEAEEDGLVTLTMAVAEGKCGKSEIADFFRSRTH
jgi:death on curing protein